MKKKSLLCFLGFILAGLLSTSPVAAFSFLGAKDLGNSGDDTEINWLEGLPDTGTNLTLTQKVEGVDKWGDSEWKTPIAYGAGTYIILKTGNLGTTNLDHFAFMIEGGDSFATYDDLIKAMLKELNAASGLTDIVGTLDFWKGKASHFTIAATPIPSAILLFGSGILGLVGIRIRSRKGQTLSNRGTESQGS